MRKYFICLANSEKKNGRCLAGIEINIVDQKVKIVYEDEHPKWIRPVVYQDLTGIPYDEVYEIDLLDIVGLDVKENIPIDFHSENVYYQSGSITSTQRLLNDEDVIDTYVDPYGPLFLDTTAKIEIESAKRLNRSIMLIRVNDFVCVETEFEGKKKVRGSFTFDGAKYDFPITDPVFKENYWAGKDSLEMNRYLTISLGTEFEGFYWKLIAGIIECGEIL